MDRCKIPIALMQLYSDMAKITPKRYIDVIDIEDKVIFRYKSTPDFIFIVEMGGNENFICIAMPARERSNKSETTMLRNPESVINEYKKWLKIIANYQAIPTQINAWDFEDTYYEELHSNIILDEDAEYAPFDMAKQLYLEEYCHVTIEALQRERQKAGADVEAINEIIQEVENVKKDIPRLSKAETFRRFCRIWAMIKKYSISLFKELTKTILFDFVKDKTIEVAGSIRDAWPMLIEGAKQLIE